MRYTVKHNILFPVMPTKSCIYALNSYAAVFQRFGNLPLRWDVQKKKFIYRLSHRELLFWYFCLTVIFCCGIICLREIFVKVTNVTTHILVVQILFGMLGAVGGCGCGLLLLIYGQVGVTTWDNICLIENILKKGMSFRYC